MRHHRALLIFSVLTWVLSKGLNVHFGRTVGGGTGFYLTIIFRDILPILGGGALIVSVLKVLIFEKTDRPLQTLMQNYRRLFFDMSRVTNIIVVMAAMILGISGFSELKPLIHFIKPYSWDVTFMEIDRVLHFGRDPWTLLTPIFGSASATRTINFVYNFWFYVIFIFWIMAAWSKPNMPNLIASNDAAPSKLTNWSRQFTLAFIMTWVIGGFLLAILFSSMGPAFYGLIDPSNNPFAAQMASLHAMDAESSLWAIKTQGLLQDSYLNPASGGPEGISAMPSVHNATAALYVFAGYKIKRYIGHIMVAFMIAILIGSVHLGWHYAIDGYVGIALAWACWWGAGRILKRV